MKKTTIISVVLVGVLGYFGVKFYTKNYKNNVQKAGYIVISKNSKIEDIFEKIKPYLKDKNTFREVALSKNMDEKFKSGRYYIQKGMGNAEIVNMIKAGNQSEDTFRIGDFGDVYQMIGRVSQKTEADSLQFVKEFDKIAQDKGLQNAEDLKKYFFIDTYNFYWSVSPQQFFKKFEKQYDDFWTADRQEKYKNMGLTREQVYALASIVYKESGGKPDEQKTIAGLYLNRYRKGMKLQSDPTVIYAVSKDSQFKTKIKRVLYKDLKNPSLYNTYANKGIPPGPICIVDKKSIDAVLNAEKNNYIFMCADTERVGYHIFTDSDVEHAKNAKKYQEWLDKKNIKN